MTEPLHVKYRPKTLEEFRGHEAMKESLKGVLEGESMPHVFAFYGPRGCGKTTLGRIIANHVGCNSMDLIEMDAASNRGIDDVRLLKGGVPLAPLYGKVKVYLIDEAHGLTALAEDTLLKTLEDDCPAHTYFVLCSTDPQKIKTTIKSRCAEYTVSRVGLDLINGLLDDVCEAEHFPDNVPSDDVLNVVAECADGVLREALVHLAMVKDFTDPEKAREVISEGSQSAEFTQLLNAVLNREPVVKVLACYKGLPERDPVKVRMGIVNSIKKRMLGTKKAREMDSLANLLQCFARPINYEMAEAELVLDFYLAVKG